MNRHVATGLLASLVASSIAGCHAEFRAGGNEAKPPPPAQTAPPPPPPAPAASAEEKPKPRTLKMSFTVKDGKIDLPGSIVFKTNEATLEPQSEPVLQLVADYLNQEPKVTKLRIEGHTDNVGDPAKNKELSIARAAAVGKWLIGKGIQCDRLVPVGFGQERPIAANDTEEGRAQNRRTEFRNAQLNGKPILGQPVDGGGTPAADPCTNK